MPGKRAVGQISDYQNAYDLFPGRCLHRRKAFRCRHPEGHEGYHAALYDHDLSIWFEWDDEGREVERA